MVVGCADNELVTTDGLVTELVVGCTDELVLVLASQVYLTTSVVTMTVSVIVTVNVMCWKSPTFVTDPILFSSPLDVLSGVEMLPNAE